MAKDTCRREDCTFWSLFDGKCPNYYESTFYPKGKVEESYKVHDCAPIRTMLMIQDLTVQLIGVQKSNEQQRNDAQKVLGVLKVIVQEAQKRKIDAVRKDEVPSIQERADSIGG
jgi:hypothetical protein